MIDRTHDLPVVRQVQLLDLSRSSVYYLPQPTPEGDLQLMRRIDEFHLEHPFAGARMLRDILKLEGVEIGRKHVSTLMKKMGGDRQTQRLGTVCLAQGNLGKLTTWPYRQIDELLPLRKETPE